MAYIYFTSDLHLDHLNIITYCKRPYSTVSEMNIKLISNINERVKPEDTLIHVGDFFFKIPNKKTSEYSWEKHINCKVVHVRGNHDSNNSSKSIFLSCLVEIGKKKVLICHKPPEKKEQIPFACDFVLCGHVHNAWKLQINKRPNNHNFLGATFINEQSNIDIPIINIGCDVWEFRPVRLDEILSYYQKIIQVKL